MDKERQYSFIMTEENKNKVEQFLKLLNIDADIIEAENIKKQPKEEQKEWPQDGDDYYFIDSDGEITIDHFFSGYSFSEDRLAIGNCFKTKEDAKFELERINVITEMKKFAESEDREWDGIKHHWYLYYDVNDDIISYSYVTLCKSHDIYFESKEKARECVNTIGANKIKKFYLRVNK